MTTSINIEYLFFLFYRLITGGNDASGAVDLIKDVWFGVNITAAISVPFLLLAFFYTARKLEGIIHAERERYEAAALATTAGGSTANDRWNEILEHVKSENPSNWRLAIIEADVMLDDLLKRRGYIGDTLGERLKALQSTGFKTLDKAWEAHRVRNQIAHQGSDFVLTQREARRVIELYRQVFEEQGVV